MTTNPVGLIVAGTTVVVLSACGGHTQGVDELAADQHLAQSCPTGHRLGGLGSVDLSGSARDNEILASHEPVIRSLVRRIAVCSGHLKVVGFSSSAAATSVAFDDDLQPAGATDIARLRKVPALVETTMKTINDGLDRARKELPATGTDDISQFEVAREYITQLNTESPQGSPYALIFELMTDGVQTTGGAVLNTPDLDPASAEGLASRGPAPAFPTGTSVRVSGVGKVAGSPPPTSYIDALKAFFRTYCLRTTPTCSVVTDATTGS
jgi:hypothetical protein